jgi:addiction module HigA family antidote
MPASFLQVKEIVNGKRGITPDTALRLAKLFGTTAELWLNGQSIRDLWHATRSPQADEIEEIEPVSA